MCNHKIQWPTISVWWQRKIYCSDMPNVVSAIDGTSHEIQIPSNEPQQKIHFQQTNYFHWLIWKEILKTVIIINSININKTITFLLNWYWGISSHFHDGVPMQRVCQEHLQKRWFEKKQRIRSWHRSLFVWQMLQNVQRKGRLRKTRTYLFHNM